MSQNNAPYAPQPAHPEQPAIAAADLPNGAQLPATLDRLLQHQQLQDGCQHAAPQQPCGSESLLLPGQLRLYLLCTDDLLPVSDPNVQLEQS